MFPPWGGRVKPPACCAGSETLLRGLADRGGAGNRYREAEMGFRLARSIGGCMLLNVLVAAQLLELVVIDVLTDVVPLSFTGVLIESEVNAAVNARVRDVRDDRSKIEIGKYDR